MRKVLDTLEKQGFRPRIQDAWRSKEDQLKAFNAGASKLKFGFHNATGTGGRKEALACDVLDDDNPFTPPTRRSPRRSTAAARAQGLSTGLLWGLPPQLVAGVEAALAAKKLDARVSVGWDPTHTQIVGLTPVRVRNGERPKGGAGPLRAMRATSGVATGGGKVHVVVAGDTLSKIAKNAGITLARLLELNPQFQPNPNLIHIGDKIRLK